MTPNKSRHSRNATRLRSSSFSGGVTTEWEKYRDDKFKGGYVYLYKG